MRQRVFGARRVLEVGYIPLSNRIPTLPGAVLDE